MRGVPGRSSEPPTVSSASRTPAIPATSRRNAASTANRVCTERPGAADFPGCVRADFRCRPRPRISLQQPRRDRVQTALRLVARLRCRPRGHPFAQPAQSFAEVLEVRVQLHPRSRPPRVRPFREPVRGVVAVAGGVAVQRFVASGGEPAALQARQHRGQGQVLVAPKRTQPGGRAGGERPAFRVELEEDPLPGGIPEVNPVRQRGPTILSYLVTFRGLPPPAKLSSSCMPDREPKGHMCRELTAAGDPRQPDRRAGDDRAAEVSLSARGESSPAPGAGVEAGGPTRRQRRGSCRA